MASRAPLPELSDQTRNRWPGILPMLGIEASCLTGKQCPCPVCGGKDRFRFDNLDGKGTWICNNCGAGDGVRLLELKHGWSFKDAAAEIRGIVGDVQPSKPGRRADPADALRWCHDLWNKTGPAAGTELEAYLLSRGFTPPFPAALRFCTQTPIKDIPGRSTMPAMIARITGPDGKGASLHRTFLENGRKASIEKPRQVMPGLIPDGSAIRLSNYSDELGVGEGIETANAAQVLFGVPTWATTSSTMLEKFTPPARVRVLHIFGDHDKKFGGQASAYRLAHRIACRDGAPEVRVHIPEKPGEDWDDVRASRHG